MTAVKAIGGRVRVLPAVICILFIAMMPRAGACWNHTEIDWRTIKTDHFEIHYHPGEEWSAAQAARIAEEIYGPLTAFYSYEPGAPIHISLFDKSDVVEGATYYYLNRVDISASDVEFHLRGTSSWLRNVITHEVAHLISIQSGMKLPRRIPALYVQVLSFEREKRPDVITGYPNFQMSVPIAGEIVPNWFAEGTAQFQCGAARHDFWDTHRDMLLRAAVLSDRLLSLDEMGVFGKNSLKAEMLYNQGFSMVLFIANRFGPQKVTELMHALSALTCWSFNGACKRVLGVSADDLYRLWREEMGARYRDVLAGVEPDRREGARIAGRGFMNLFPAAARGGGLLYLSNRGRDYSDLDLVRMGEDGTARKIDDGVTSRFDIAPAGDICYSKRTKKNDYGYAINDIFIFRAADERSKRLTHGMRASDPAWSPDGGRIACVVSADGTDRLSIIDVESAESAPLAAVVPGRQYYGLSWGRRGILACRFDGLSRDVVLIDPATGDETPILEGDADERDPVWGVDGDGFLYASDRTGIFNIYYHDMERGTDRMVTNTIGGAFSPWSCGDGCLFSAFGADGYEVRRIDDWRSVATRPVEDEDDGTFMDARCAIIGRRSATLRADTTDAKDEQGRRIDERISAGGENFGISYTSLFFFPTFQVYDGSPRLGLSVDSRDMLDRQSVFAAGTIGLRDSEFDFYLSFETRQFKPTFSLDVFRSRKFYSYITRIGGSMVDLYTRYDLWDAYFTCRFELRPPTPLNRKEIALRYNHGEYGLNIEAFEVFHREVGWTYYKGDEISLIFNYRDIRPEVDADINPRRGRDIHLEVTRAYNKLSSGEFEYNFMPIYGKNYYGRYLLQYEEYVPLPMWHHAVSLFVKGGALDNVNIDDFFYLYLGSRDGLRGYSYYSMGGTKLAMARLTYRFPLLRRIHRQFFNLYLHSLYLGLFAEAGKAWNEEELDLRGNKKDVGFEVRVKGFTFYSYPLAVSFEAAYGLNDVEYTDPFNDEMTFYEGKNWKYYGSVLFSF